MKIHMTESELSKFKKQLNKVYPASEARPHDYFSATLIPIWEVEIKDGLYNYVMNYDSLND